MILTIGLILLTSTLHTGDGIRMITERENIELQRMCGISGLHQYGSSAFKTIKGNVAQDGDFPWAVHIYVSIRNIEVMTCTGSFISRWHVITAAHCLLPHNNANSTIIAGTPCTYEFFKMRGAKFTKCESKSKEPVQTFITKGYVLATDIFDTKINYYNAFTDFAIIELESPVNFSKHIKPICLPKFTNNIDNIAEAAMYSFGATDISVIRARRTGLYWENTMLIWLKLQKCELEECDNERLDLNDCKHNVIQYCSMKKHSECSSDSGAGLEGIINKKHVLIGIRLSTNEAVCLASYEREQNSSLHFIKLQIYSDFICNQTGVCPNRYQNMVDGDNLENEQSEKIADIFKDSAPAAGVNSIPTYTRSANDSKGVVSIILLAAICVCLYSIKNVSC